MNPRNLMTVYLFGAYLQRRFFITLNRYGFMSTIVVIGGHTLGLSLMLI
jgi:hypothetical protein